MKKNIVFIFLLFIFLCTGFKVNAEDCGGSVDEKITCYSNNIVQLRNSGKTLSNQIAQFNTQIILTTLKIAQTEEQIKLLSGRISQLEVSLQSLTKAFYQRVLTTYKMSKTGDNFLLLVTSNDLNQAYETVLYLKKIQDSDKNLLQKLTKAQNIYKDEKLDQEELQTKLESQKRDLSIQKTAKNTLLLQTKSDEKKYQMLLSQALAEKAAIEKALVSGVKVGPVKAGDPIGLVGNSGYPNCSTGKHLHFEIRKNNAWIDPSLYLQNKNVNDEERGGTANLGNGSWPWPIQDTIRLTQHYGQTPYSWRYSYSGGIHTGLDMVSTTSDVIRAPADGNLYKSSEKCGSSTINVVYIDHGDNLMSFYLHVQ